MLKTSKFSNFLKNLDAYPKVKGDGEIFRKSLSGATVTVISVAIIFFLIALEIHAYLSLNITEELFVDTTRNHKLKISLDITIGKISCDYLSLDAMDLSGEEHLQIEDDIYKLKLNLNGEPLEDQSVKETIKTAQTTTQHVKLENLKESNSTDECGSCYGAEYNSTHCCKTCEDVLEAYRHKQWDVNIQNFKQCQTGLTTKINNEGCRIYGHMKVNRVGGSFHISPGKSFSLNHIHAHDVRPFASKDYILMHTVNHLSFGEPIDLANTHPIDGLHINTEKVAMMFQYYIKIVPTVYVKTTGEIIHTNQFSVTRHEKQVTVNSGESGMPGIFFNYELSPLMVKYTERHRSFGHFATNVCSIIGGVFTVAGIIVSFWQNSFETIKLELIKDR